MRYYYDKAQIRRLLEADFDPQHRALVALVAGSGLPLADALAVKAGQVYQDVKAIQLDRPVFVNQWAWDYFYPVVDFTRPNARVFSFGSVEAEFKLRGLASHAGVPVDGFEAVRLSLIHDLLERGAPMELVQLQWGEPDPDEIRRLAAELTPLR